MLVNIAFSLESTYPYILPISRIITIEYDKEQFRMNVKDAHFTEFPISTKTLADTTYEIHLSSDRIYCYASFLCA